jgi:hypothetical protein
VNPVVLVFFDNVESGPGNSYYSCWGREAPLASCASSLAKTCLRKSRGNFCRHDNVLGEASKTRRLIAMRYRELVAHLPCRSVYPAGLNDKALRYSLQTFRICLPILKEDALPLNEWRRGKEFGPSRVKAKSFNSSAYLPCSLYFSSRSIVSLWAKMMSMESVAFVSQTQRARIRALRHIFPILYHRPTRLKWVMDRHRNDPLYGWQTGKE